MGRIQKTETPDLGWIVPMSSVQVLGRVRIECVSSQVLSAGITQSYTTQKNL